VRQTLYLDNAATVISGSLLEHLMHIDQIWWDHTIEFSGRTTEVGFQRIMRMVRERKQIDMRWHVHGLDTDKWLRLQAVPVRYKDTTVQAGEIITMLEVEPVGLNSVTGIYHMQDVLYRLRKREEFELRPVEFNKEVKDGTY